METASQQRDVKKYSSSRLIMNKRWLWNSHQRHKFLRDEASRDILRNGISKGFQGVFSTANAMLFHQNTCKTENKAIEMSQAFYNIVWFRSFTDLNLFKYTFSVIQNLNMDALQFYSMVLIFC